MVSILSVSKIVLTLCVAINVGTGQYFTRLGVQVSHVHVSITHPGKTVFPNNA